MNNNPKNSQLGGISEPGRRLTVDEVFSFDTWLRLELKWSEMILLLDKN